MSSSNPLSSFKSQVAKDPRNARREQPLTASELEIYRNQKLNNEHPDSNYVVPKLQPDKRYTNVNVDHYSRPVYVPKYVCPPIVDPNLSLIEVYYTGLFTGP